jgi:hypothetical protein
VVTLLMTALEPLDPTVPEATLWTFQYIHLFKLEFSWVQSNALLSVSDSPGSL